VENKDSKVWGYFYRGAGARFTEDPAREMSAMQDETVPLKGLHAFDRAHVVMLLEQGLIPREDGRLILRALHEMDEEGYEAVRRRVGGAGHSGEAYLIQKLGMEIGGQLHLGRSSGDLLAVTIRIEERDRILDMLEGISLLNKSLLELAGSHTTTVMPTYTHLQQAQPGSLAHYLVSWAYAFGRDFARLQGAYRRTNASPAGAAIGTGSPFSIDRERVASLLGFDSVLQNTRDAIFGFDHHLELFSSVAILDSNLARLCSDLYLWSSHEFDMAEPKDRFCGTSSINAGKKNPQALEQIQGLAALAIGALNTAFAIDRIPSEAWEIEWRTWSQQLWPLLRKTVQALTLLRMVLESTEFKTSRMAELANVGWITSADLASALVREQALPWRIAHQVVAQLVRTCVERGIHSREITSGLVDEIAEARTGKKLSMPQAAIDQACNPLECVKMRQLIGGPAPEEMARQIGQCRRTADEQKNAVKAARDSLTKAEARLAEAVEALAGPARV
jgi:argininosuccinate lyase